MKWYILGALFISALILKILYDKWDMKRKMNQKLRESFGKINTQLIPPEMWDTISSYYESIADARYDLDEITWNDLDLQDIFQEMNQTLSSVGEEYLYALLHRPIISEDEWKERKRLISVFISNEEERMTIGKILYELGKIKKMSAYEYINVLEKVKHSSIWHNLLFVILPIASLFVIEFNQMLGILALVIFLGIDIIQYYREKAQLGPYYQALIYLLRMLYTLEKIEKCKLESLSAYQKQAEDLIKQFKRFRRGSMFIASSVDGGSLIDILLDYVRMIFHADLVKCKQMIHCVRNHNQELHDIYEIIGKLDAMYTLASYRMAMGIENTCEPEFTQSSSPSISFCNLYHPLLEHPVKASMTENQSVLLTGSNASGKSTFLKAVALNTLFAQTITFALADEYKASHFQILSSMALTDSIRNNESYFIVEIKSIKRIFSHLNEEIPVLCFVDEVLRGTNTLERIAASSQILKDLSEKNALCFAATHDLELTYILEKYYHNYHFTEEIVDRQVTFEYLLHRGRATSRNAIQLLSMLGYDREIVENAMQSAKEYQENGKWKNFE